MFQSLTGRLKTGRRFGRAAWWGLFQSLTGRLKTDQPCGEVRGNLRFNPSQVG